MSALGWELPLDAIYTNGSNAQKVYFAKWHERPLAAIHGFRPCRAAAFALLPFMHPAANCWAKRRPPDKVTIYAYFRKVRIQRVVIMIGCVNRVELTSQQDRIHPNCLAKWCLALQTICQVRLTFKEISFHGVADRLRNPLMLSLNHPIVENQL